MNAWQVQHEDHHQRGTSAGQPAADEEKMEPKLDFKNSKWITCYAAVEQQEDSRTRLIRKLVHLVKHQPNTDASMTELQKKIVRIIPSAKNQNIWSNLWETWNVSSYVRSLPLCNVLVA